MGYAPSSSQGRRGITVLALAILIIIVVLAAIFLIRYLGHRPATATSLAPRPVELVIASDV
jgi:hypothetical protein